ncbi:hypothetical protein SAMN05421863_108414 [Nitrosomonas communis]|uniref:Uncharacterized protein n=1 Tax=Nitrosomonas communis TaxID=44574 RepID=A0A1I4VIV3_9PROT|nr:hypothetical protein SAMN05421863_108414 [Nitrosomonas communis]
MLECLGRYISAYISDVQIIIEDARGFTVLETITKGPNLFAKLPAGKYFLDATTK